MNSCVKVWCGYSVSLSVSHEQGRSMGGTLKKRAGDPHIQKRNKCFAFLSYIPNCSGIQGNLYNKKQTTVDT